MPFVFPVARTRPRLFTLFELALGAGPLIAAGTILSPLLVSTATWAVTAALYGVIALLTLCYWDHGPLGWANRVTLARAILVAIVAGALAERAFIEAIWLWLAVALVSLALDGVDGFVARKTNSHSRFGARFDMELDALMILLLCIALLKLESLGAWVLMIGGMRYAFVLASWRLEWLSAPLFESFRRKTVCVWQVVALLLALTPLTSHTGATLLALSALIASLYSFGVDVGWLYRRRLEP
ncbi:CDP-alcohol phosphatidyltransferase family protein [Halomonas sp. PAMB 3264]|uniref:CDP-alcohol phosphatidyltransferase family protein n=1 Tax=Halomonas sp. PAMB 3264 TaxID=3075222 RepID=UPI00289D73B6|nr:CDP-alcohol phosphatidyltransferase family protein [Halomonas sp. PAMB 3264]WNL41391.1 CDP-alcohol phosphatidyltransferase family protein [Halomonas sp. PAMB 3264]